MPNWPVNSSRAMIDQVISNSTRHLCSYRPAA
jgi:hypothetical protein